MKPGQQKEGAETEGVRNQEMYNATEYLRQAKRYEQIARRLDRATEVERRSRTYEVLAEAGIEAVGKLGS